MGRSLKAKPRAIATTRKTRSSNAKGKFCVCHGADDKKSPMIMCDDCKDWFHFRCINLAERDAEDIQIYICAACHERTGRTTIMKWEGSDAELKTTLNAEDPLEGEDRGPSEPEVEDKTTPEPEEPDYQDDDGDSSEEYIGEEDTKSRRQASRSARRVNDSDDEDDDTLSRSISPTARRRLSRLGARYADFTPSTKLKRKSSAVTRPSKRRKSMTEEEDKSASEDAVLVDPVRKYCLGKLQAVLLPIFEGYGEKESAEKAAGAYVSELERALYDNFSETDPKTGRPIAGAKYKERFRMLVFNVEQKDRVVLHKRIASGDLPPRELSQMSSIELANEQKKQEIEAVLQESLQHSILEMRRAAPRAKITHKGEEVIEDIAGEDDLRRTREEEERERERERARVTDPAVHSPSEPEQESPSAVNEPLSPSLDNAMPSLSLNTPVTTNFDIGDLIHIDLPDSPHSPPAEISQPAPASPVTNTSQPTAQQSGPIQSPVRGSFSLSTLWSGGAEGTDARPTSNEQGPKDEGVVDVDMGGIPASDRDFDVFLSDGEGEPPQGAPMEEAKDKVPAAQESEQSKFEALKQVWMGDLSMPLDAPRELRCPVVARQVGGRAITSPHLWDVLFPKSQAMIEGRVPTENSNTYLVNTRLNAGKELIAVALTPAPGADESKFDELFDFLLNKDRHGLIFPWGTRPIDGAPGKEFYLIPLSPSQPIPESVQLLDHVAVPQNRINRMFIGVFILFKGKLVASKAPPLVNQPPQPIVIPPPIPPLPPSSMPVDVNAVPLPVNASVPPQLPITLPPGFSLDKISADFASLTPQQLEIVARSLSQINPGVAAALLPATASTFSNPSYSATSVEGTSAPIPQYAAQHPPSLPSSFPQPWVPQSPPHGEFSHQARANQSAPSGQRGDLSPPHHYQDSSRDRRGSDRGREHRKGFPRGNNGRGGGPRDRDEPRQRDSGWGPRGRGRGHGNRSPTRGQQPWATTSPSRNSSSQPDWQQPSQYGTTYAPWIPPQPEKVDTWPHSSSQPRGEWQ